MRGSCMCFFVLAVGKVYLVQFGIFLLCEFYGELLGFSSECHYGMAATGCDRRFKFDKGS